MKKRIKKIFNNKFVKFFVIPTLLLGTWACLTLLYTIVYDKSFLVLSYNHEQVDFKQVTYEPLQKGEKIGGEFEARENNLGILTLRFEQVLRMPYKDEDELVFRIKEKGDKQWHYEGKYMSGLIFDVPFLPFGFPVIHESQGKRYTFELESLRGNSKNGVVLSERAPNLVSKYQVSKEELSSDRKALIFFTFKKLFASLQTIDVIFSSFIYLMPFILYMVYLSPLKKVLLLQLIRLRNIFISYITILLLIALFSDILFLQINNDLLYIIFIVVWTITIKLQRQNAGLTFAVSIILLLLTPFFYSLDNVSMALKANSWAYVYLVGGTLQLFYESIGTKKSKK
ncbi:MAG: hypothetical protein H0W89_00210 [Candidatus Levybacteria bacterium]|nr:hypothetical protein [Candidatus Levybacteria bacterium]